MQLQFDGYVALLLMCLAGVMGCGNQASEETSSSENQPASASLPASVSSENPPRIISTSPANGEIDVDPALQAITVTFDQPMKADSFAWSYEKKEDFPDVQGTPAYDEKQTTNTLPVKLAPGREYAIWLNTSELKGFVSVDGEPSPPYKLVFSTRAVEGNGTPDAEKPDFENSAAPVAGGDEGTSQE